VPFNIASYALFTHLVAREIGADVGDLILTFGDVHIYSNHNDAVEEQLTRKPYDFPSLDIGNVSSLYSVTVDDCKLVNYLSHATIKADMAV
jgi:thymidylate synthase